MDKIYLDTLLFLTSKTLLAKLIRSSGQTELTTPSFTCKTLCLHLYCSVHSTVIINDGHFDVLGTQHCLTHNRCFIYVHCMNE